MMNKIMTLGFILLCSGCILQDNCYDTQGDPISEFDNSFLPYSIDSMYIFKDLSSNNIVAFKCDTSFEYWQNIFMDGDCDFYAKTNIRKVILSSVSSSSENNITISASIVSSKVNNSFSYYTERNKCRELLIDIHYANVISFSDYHYSCYIERSNPNLTYYNTGGALADSTFGFYETLNLNGRSYNNVNEVIGSTSNTYNWSDTLYINNEYGILRFKIKELDFDLIYNQ